MSEVLDFLPRPCHVFTPENSLTHLSASKVQPSTILKMLHSSDANSQGSLCFVLHSEPSQPHVSPSVAGSVPFAEEIPNKSWLNLIEVILMSLSFKKSPFYQRRPEKLKQNFKKGISFEYWFIKATYLQHE